MSPNVKSDFPNGKLRLLSKKVFPGFNLVSVTVFTIFRIEGLWPWPLTSQGHPKWSSWTLYMISVVCNIVSLAVLGIFQITWFLTPQGHLRSNLTVPIESPWALSYMTSFEFKTVSLTVWPQITQPTNQPTKDIATTCVAIGPVCNTMYCSLDLIINSML